MPTPEELEAAARRREIEELKRIWDENPNNPENRVPTDEEIQQAIQDQDMEEGNYLQAPYDFNQAMQIGQYFASQGMPPEIDPKKHRQNQRQEKIRDLSERPGTSAEGEAAKKKLKRPEDLPNFLQSVEMGEIYRRDAEKYGEFDRLVKEGKLKEAAKVRARIEAEEWQKRDPSMKGTDWVGDLGTLALAKPIAAYVAAQPLAAGLKALEGIGIMSTDPENFSDIQSELLSQQSLLNPVKKAVNIGRGMKTILKEVWKLGEGILPGGKYGDLIDAGTGIAWDNLKEVVNNPRDLIRTTRTAKALGNNPLQMTGSGGGSRAMSGGAEEGSKQFGIFNRGGLRNSTYDHWKYKDEGWMSSNEARKTLEAYQTRSRRYVPGFFERERNLLRPRYIEEYGDYMVRNGLATAEDIASGKVGRNLELHHITPLKASAPLYHNTTHGDEAWTVVTDVFNKHGLFPGQGLPSPIESENISNYFMALQEPHNILHNQFLKDLLGRDGSTFFTPARMELIESGLEGRRLVAEEYALHIKQGQAILEDAMKQMEALFSKSGIPPEELSNLLARASNTGELKILDTDLMVRSVNDQLRNIAEEASWEDYGTALGDEVPEVLQRHIDKGIQAFYTRVMKAYGLGGRHGYGKPPIQP